MDGTIHCQTPVAAKATAANAVSHAATRMTTDGRPERSAIHVHSGPATRKPTGNSAISAALKASGAPARSSASPRNGCSAPTDPIVST